MSPNFVLRKKIHLPRKTDHESGQDANGCFEQMCINAGLELICDQDQFPDVDVHSGIDPEENFELKIGILKGYPFGSWNFISE